MNETVINNLIVMLARGDGEAASRYLSHFSREVRSPPTVRANLGKTVQPRVMTAFEEIAPWLLNEALDETPARIRRALFEAGMRGLTLSELAGTMPSTALIERRETLDAMVQTGELHVEVERTGGRPAYRYRLAVYARPAQDRGFSPDLPRDGNLAFSQDLTRVVEPYERVATSSQF